MPVTLASYRAHARKRPDRILFLIDGAIPFTVNNINVFSGDGVTNYVPRFILLPGTHFPADARGVVLVVRAHIHGLVGERAVYQRGYSVVEEGTSTGIDTGIIQAIPLAGKVIVEDRVELLRTNLASPTFTIDWPVLVAPFPPVLSCLNADGFVLGWM